MIFNDSSDTVFWSLRSQKDLMPKGTELLSVIERLSGEKDRKQLLGNQGANRSNQSWKKDPSFPTVSLPWTQEENKKEGIAQFTDKVVQPQRSKDGTILEYWWFCF